MPSPIEQYQRLRRRLQQPHKRIIPFHERRQAESAEVPKIFDLPEMSKNWLITLPWPVLDAIIRDIILQIAPYWTSALDSWSGSTFLREQADWLIEQYTESEYEEEGWIIEEYCINPESDFSSRVHYADENLFWGAEQAIYEIIATQEEGILEELIVGEQPDSPQTEPVHRILVELVAMNMLWTLSYHCEQWRVSSTKKDFAELVYSLISQLATLRRLEEIGPPVVENWESDNLDNFYYQVVLAWWSHISRWSWGENDGVMLRFLPPDEIDHNEMTVITFYREAHDDARHPPLRQQIADEVIGRVFPLRSF